MSTRDFEEWELDRNARRPFVISRLKADEVADEVAAAWGMSREELFGSSRDAMHASARAVLYERLRAGGWSFPCIGKYVGGRHHTTIMYALDAANTSKRKRVNGKAA